MEFQITMDDINGVGLELTDEELEYMEAQLDQMTESMLESWYATSFGDMLREEMKWRINLKMADDAEVNENENDDP